MNPVSEFLTGLKAASQNQIPHPLIVNTLGKENTGAQQVDIASFIVQTKW